MENSPTHNRIHSVKFFKSLKIRPPSRPEFNKFKVHSPNSVSIQASYRTYQKDSRESSPTQVYKNPI